MDTLNYINKADIMLSKVLDTSLMLIGVKRGRSKKHSPHSSESIEI